MAVVDDKAHAHMHDSEHLSLIELNVLYDRRDTAEEAARMLGTIRSRTEDVKIWPARGSTFVAVDERLESEFRSARKEALRFGVLGAVVVGAIAIAVISSLAGVGISMLLGAFAGLGLGGTFGALYGLQVADRPDEDAAVEVTPAAGAYVLTCLAAQPAVTRRLLEDFGGRAVMEPGHNVPVVY